MRTTSNNISAAEYIDEIVEPTLRDLELNPTSVRHAFLAAVTVYHTIDYMDVRNKRQRFRGQSRAFCIVDRVAHAFKHVRAGHQNDRNNHPLEYGDVIPRPPAAWGVMVLGLSRIGDTTGGVTISEDLHIDLLATFREAVRFLGTQTE